MVYMRLWLKALGEDSMAFSTHSLHRGASTHAHKANITDLEIQCLGHWKSDCYKQYIQEDTQSKVTTCFKFNKML